MVFFSAERIGSKKGRTLGVHGRLTIAYPGEEVVAPGKTAKCVMLSPADDRIPDEIYERVQATGDGFAVFDLGRVGSHTTACSLLRECVVAALTCQGTDERNACERAKDRLTAIGSIALDDGNILRGVSFQDHARRAWEDPARQNRENVARLGADLLYGLNKGAFVVQRGGGGDGNEGDPLKNISALRDEIRSRGGQAAHNIPKIAQDMNGLLDFRHGEEKYRNLRAVCIRHLTLVSIAAGLDAVPNTDRQSIGREFMNEFLRAQGWRDDPRLQGQEAADTFIGEVLTSYGEKMQAIERTFGPTQGYGYHHMPRAIVAAPLAPQPATAGAPAGDAARDPLPHLPEAAPLPAVAADARAPGPTDTTTSIIPPEPASELRPPLKELNERPVERGDSPEAKRPRTGAGPATADPVRDLDSSPVAQGAPQVASDPSSVAQADPVSVPGGHAEVLAGRGASAIERILAEGPLRRQGSFAAGVRAEAQNKQTDGQSSPRS